MNFKQLFLKTKLHAQKKLGFLNLYKILTHKYIDKINKQEFLKPPFNLFNERPVEYGFVFNQIAKFYPKKILDIGTGVTALPHLMANCGCDVTAIDNIKDYWKKGMFNRHYHIINDDITKSQIKDKFDLITCISVLEHIEDYGLAIKNMFNLLKKGGLLILTFPYSENEFIDDVYVLPNSNVGKALSYKTRSYSRKKINEWLADNNAKIVEQEYWQFFTDKFWTTGKRKLIPKLVTKNDLHQISCILFQKNK